MFTIWTVFIKITSIFYIQFHLEGHVSPQGIRQSTRLISTTYYTSHRRKNHVLKAKHLESQEPYFQTVP